MIQFTCTIVMITILCILTALDYLTKLNIHPVVRVVIAVAVTIVLTLPPLGVL